jgi:hypothetical protein
MMKMVKQSGLSGLIGYLCLTMLTGCSTVRMEVADPTSPVQFPSALVEKITLTVVVPPDQFKTDEDNLYELEHFQRSLAGSLERGLASSGGARSVALSPSQGSWTMYVVAKWDSRSTWYEAIGKGFQLFILFFLLFIPYPFMSASFSVRTEAEVKITDPSGAERGRTSVQTRMDAEVAARKSSKEVSNAIQDVSSEELANRILLDLKRHPHWFVAAR